MDAINPNGPIKKGALIKVSEILNSLSVMAGLKIMEYYGVKSHKIKSDGSPLTLADLEANRIITFGLNQSFKNIPIISEEGNKSCQNDIFFLVDPLDGTKEFLSQNGEFTVNIALIKKGEPILGSVYLPEKDELYWTDGKESYVKSKNKKKIIKVSEFKKKYYKIEISRSHMDEKTKRFIKYLNPFKTNMAGSSLKICNISLGKSNLYPRFSRVNTWDIAAGHAILKKAGGEIFKLNGKKFTYSCSDYKVESFLAFAKRKLPDNILNYVKKN